MARRRTSSGKVNLRYAHSMCGYSGNYAWFVRTKVVPIIGESALHPAPSLKDSKVREYKVTKKNLLRVLKSLGAPTRDIDKLLKTEAVVRKSDPFVTAKVIHDLLEKSGQPRVDPSYPINFRIPMHPISHNDLYISRGGRLVRSAKYKKWRLNFFKLIPMIVGKKNVKVDFTKPLTVDLKFGHKEESSEGHYFDMQNFAKAAIDCSFEHFEHSDHLISKLSMDRVLVEDYPEGFIEVRIRNN